MRLTALKQYGFLDRIVAALETLIPSKKAILMVLPAVMGILTVPGGAYLSAPFVDKIGDDLELSAPRKVVVNLSFRHVALFIMPFTTNMLFIPTVVPEINIYHLIALNVGFILCMHTAAYFIYLHRAKSVRVQTGGSKKKAVLDLLLYLSPIYLVVFFNGPSLPPQGLGMRVPPFERVRPAGHPAGGRPPPYRASPAQGLTGRFYPPWSARCPA